MQVFLYTFAVFLVIGCEKEWEKEFVKQEKVQSFGTAPFSIYKTFEIFM